MRTKVTLTKNFSMKASTEQPWTPNSNTGVIKESKAMAQETLKT